MIFELSLINVINVICITIGIGVCGLCFLQITSSKHLQKKIQIYFQLFFLLIIIYIFAHILREIMDGQIEDNIKSALYIVTFIEMQFAGLTAFMMSVLVLTVSKVNKIEKKLQILLIILIVIHVSIIVIGHSKKLIYYFDEANVYHRSSLYILSNLCPFLMLIFDSILIAFYGKNIKPKVKNAFLFYILSPIVAIIIQSRFFGLQLIIFATIISAVYMFLVILEDLNEMYKIQQQTASRIGAELRMATDIQASQLPRLFPAFPDRPEFDLYASMTPAKEVGGDFYDFFLIDNDHIGLVIADVSGKGVPAALFMMISRVLIKTHLQNGESPAETLKNVNNQLCDGNDASFFVTVWIATIQISTGEGLASNAGHEHPALKRNNQNYELVMYKHFLPVASIEDIPFEDHSFKLNPGDSLFVYTDGVAEASNSDKELFGTDRILNSLNKNPNADPQKVLTNVMDGINEFVGQTEQFDDITMLCFHYNGQKLND